MKKKPCKPKPPPPLPQMDSGNTPPSRRTKTAERVLPPEVIEEILARLPVKTVLRFRCVSKSWRFSIDSRFFVNKRLRSSAERKVISHDTVLDDDPNKHLMTNSTLVGSCNGLLCILKQNSFFLWNPTTRISIELPKIDFQVPITKYVFGWDEGSDAYKVFVVVSEQDEKIGKVYSTLTNSWKTVEHGSLSVNNPKGFFSCGHIHWLTESGHGIESFDLKSEVFRTTEQAFKPQPYMWLMETDGCLGVVCDNNQTRFDVWVMKKYWVKESWVKQNTAPIPLEYKDNYNYTYSLQDKGGVKFFPGNNVGKRVQYHYVESLVSPVYTSRQEIEQEQVQGVPIAKDQPKRQIKRKPTSLNTNKRCQNKRKATVVEVSKESEQIAPKRQTKRRTAGEVSKDVVPRRQSKSKTAGVEVGKKVVPRRQSKRIAACAEASKEVVPRRQNKRIAALVEVSKEVVPKRQSKRRAVGYVVKETKENQEIVQEQVHTSIAEGRPKRQNKRKEMEKEQAHSSVAEGRPKRQNRRMPARYILE